MWTYNTITSNELYHFGVKGMKWGVRRYQNSDGSLTSAGQKRYEKMDGKTLQKTLQKQVNIQRRKVNGFGNGLMALKPIGENSKKTINEHNATIKSLKNNEEYKKFINKLKRLDNKMYDMDPDDYDKKYESILGEFYKNNTIGKEIYKYSGTKSLSNFNEGFKFTTEYANGPGKNITISYLKDLGYNKQGAEYLSDLLAKDRRSLQ